jgi:hypothetical protein
MTAKTGLSRDCVMGGSRALSMVPHQQIYKERGGVSWNERGGSSRHIVLKITVLINV